MVLRTVAGRRTGESADDLESWLVQLQGCPDITRTVIATCANESHGSEPATWFYVEADPDEAVARHRCVSCGQSRHVLDSADHWNFPRMWACPGCSQSIAELAAGMHVDGSDAGELARAGRPLRRLRDDRRLDRLHRLIPLPSDEVLRQL